MCTSFTYQVENGSNLLARTMDFAFVLEPDFAMIPRNYTWKSQLDGKARTTKYAFAGLSRYLGEYVFADGVNEHGLSCGVLYFTGYAAYQQETAADKENLAPDEVIFWLLSMFRTIEEVKAAVKDLNVVHFMVELLGVVPPIHWIVTDRSGAAIVIEPLKQGLVVQDNPIGVMANSPDFSWHLTNIRNYIGVRPYQLKPVEIGGISFMPFGQGSGTAGIPGDYTSPSRFLRVLFGKETIEPVDNEEDAVTAAFHILSMVEIPKGSVQTSTGADFTQYSCCMFSDTCTYYFKTYDNNQICKFDLLAEDLDAPQPKLWQIEKKQQMHQLNGRIS